jgi:hypothetical protein
LALTIDALSTFIPFQLLRPLSGAHSGAASVPNREIITDIPIQIYTTLLASAIYGVVTISAIRAFLPKYLVLYFDGLPSVSPAYEASYVPMIPVALLLGLAAHTFIFLPFAATGEAKDDTRLAEFDPASASLRQTVDHNLWGYTAKTKVVIRRTTVLMAATAINTYLQCALTVSGVESYGAVAYAGVWVLADLLVGLALGVVGGV